MGYIVAKANATAMPFVAKIEKEQAGWVVLSWFATYAEAMAALATALERARIAERAR